MWNILDATEVQQNVWKWFLKPFCPAITILLSIQHCGLLITQGLKVVMDYFNLFHTVCIYRMHLSSYSTSSWMLRLF